MFEEEQEVEQVIQQEERTRNLQAARSADDETLMAVPTRSVSSHQARINSKADQQQVKRAEAPSMDRIVNLEERHKACIYIPCSVADPQEVWHRVVDAIRKMDSADFNEIEESGDEPTYDIYSLKYMYDSFVLARTRLVRLEDEGDGEQIFIELRKLEGDGFAFTDEFQRHLEQELEEITLADERPKPQAKDEVLYLDLSDEVIREEITSNWFKNLRPTSSGTTLVYNEIETYKAMSALGWNLTSPENFDILLQNHQEDILTSTMNVLNATQHLPTAYFSALTLSQFANAGELDANWSNVKLLCEAGVHWSEETSSKFAGMQISRSREVVRLLTSVLKQVGPNCPEDGRDRAAPTVEAFLSKLSELQDTSEDYAGLDLEGVTNALTLAVEPEN